MSVSREDRLIIDDRFQVLGELAGRMTGDGDRPKKGKVRLLWEGNDLGEAADADDAE